MITYCRCCHRALSPVRQGAWCEPCAASVLEDVGRLQDLPPGTLILLSGIFNECGAFALVRAMVGVMPFDEGVTQ